MDRSRRLSRLEGELDPQAAVLRWLDDAHAYRSLVDYVRACADAPDSANPFSTLLDGLESGILRAMRGRPTDEIVRTGRRALREALRTYHLIVRLNLETEEIVRSEGLRRTALVCRMRELSFRGQLAAHGEEAASAAGASRLAGAWRDWHGALDELLTGLYAAEAAHRVLEQRYLAGHACLFADLAEEWRDLVEHVEGLHAIGAAASGQADDDGIDTLRDAATGRVDAIADRLVRFVWADTRLATGDDVGAAQLIHPLLVE